MHMSLDYIHAKVSNFVVISSVHTAKMCLFFSLLCSAAASLSNFLFANEGVPAIISPTLPPPLLQHNVRYTQLGDLPCHFQPCLLNCPGSSVGWSVSVSAIFCKCHGYLLCHCYYISVFQLCLYYASDVGMCRPVCLTF